MTKAEKTRVYLRNNTGEKDILIIALIGIVLVAASIFFILRIIGHSEKHVETVKKTKVAYSESLSWRPDTKHSESKIAYDFANSLTQEEADYGDLTLSEKSFILIGKMPKLKTLKLTRSSFDERWLSHLANSPIKHLGLHSTPVTDKAIPIILKMKNLENLDIGDSELTDEGLEGLASSKKIKRLEINLPRRITNDGIKFIGYMTQLEHLELPDAKNVTGKCLTYLTGLKNLTNLNLDSMKVEPEDLACLSSLKKLTVLSISNSGLTDDDVAEISKLTSLRFLDMNGSDFTDKELMKFARLKHLKRLSIKNCPNISEKAARELQAALPECMVSYSKSSNITDKLKRGDMKMEIDFLKNEVQVEMDKYKKSKPEQKKSKSNRPAKRPE